MKNLIVKKFVPFIAVGVLSFGLVYGDEANLQKKALTTSQQYISSAGDRSSKYIKENEKEKLVQEAIDIVLKTNKVIYLLKQNKIEDAKKELKILEKKLDELSIDYKIKKFPIDVSIIEIKGQFDIEIAKKLAKRAKEAVNNNDFILARQILNTLRDEFIIQTTYLPLELYKNAINLANKFLKKGKIESTLSQLQVALGTLEVETTIIPRPIVIASIIVEDASKIYKKDPKTALKLIEEARNRIKLAKVLGYIKTYREVKPILEEMDKIKFAILKNKDEKGLFDNLKDEMNKLKALFEK